MMIIILNVQVKFNFHFLFMLLTASYTVNKTTAEKKIAKEK